MYTHRGNKNVYKIFAGKPEGGCHFGDLGVDGNFGLR
jgi:hypothetical protein